MAETKPNFDSSSRIDDDSISVMGMSGLLLPNSLKLRGPENYLQWKQVMIRNIIATGLVKFLKTDDDKPSVDLSNWQSLKSSELDKISEWVKGNTKAANT
ncbi:hypothetical protein K3495_g8001, partial [Podosphaera aphanis]